MKLQRTKENKEKNVCFRVSEKLFNEIKELKRGKIDVPNMVRDYIEEMYKEFKKNNELDK